MKQNHFWRSNTPVSYPLVCGSRRFIFRFIRVRHWTLSPTITRIVKSIRLWQTDRVPRMGRETMHVEFWWWNLFEGPKKILENNTKTDLNGMGTALPSTLISIRRSQIIRPFVVSWPQPKMRPWMKKQTIILIGHKNVLMSQTFVKFILRRDF